jgi:thiamine biosynthesis protein ThiS
MQVIELTVNGRSVELDGETALTEYLRAVGINPSAVAVEVNGRILERSEFATARLAAGDRVEIVRMVGGGSPQP